MNEKKLFGISFFMNFVFSMLTTLLPLIVFNINESTKDINVIMITFISSLLVMRLFSIWNLLKAKTEIVLGCILFTVSCLILAIESNSMEWVFVGSFLFGLSIGLVPPAILVLLSENKDKRTFNLGIYNSIVALASIFSPIIGENIYHKNPYLLFLCWIIFASIMTIVALLLKKEKDNEESTTNYKAIYNFKKVVSNTKFQISFVILLFSSISYGSIVAYLPVYFETLSLSIGIYYLFFWAGYILIQFVRKIRYSFYTVLCTLLFVSFGQLSLVLFEATLLVYFFAWIYGLGYGSLFKVFYVEIGNFNTEEERSIGFSILSLISYIGVGIAPFFLIPFNNNWKMIFTGNLFYSIIAIIIFLFLRKRSLKDDI
jgi:membrane protein